MPRLESIPIEEMSKAQVEAYEQAVAKFGRLGGPYLAYIRIPEFMQHNQAASDYLRHNSISPRLRNFIVLTVAQYWRADFFWSVSVRNALNEDFDQRTIDAIKNETPEKIENHEEMIAYKFIAELLNSKSVTDQIYDQALKQFGEQRLVDIVASIGFYSSTCLTVIGFDMLPPADAQKHSLALIKNQDF